MERQDLSLNEYNKLVRSRIRSAQYVLQSLVKREVGEIPARSRHCETGMFSRINFIICIGDYEIDSIYHCSATSRMGR